MTLTLYITICFDSTMKLLAIAIICAIASAASVTAQGSQEPQQENKKPCKGRPEQECKYPECAAIHRYTGISNGRTTCMLIEHRVLC